MNEKTNYVTIEEVISTLNRLTIAAIKWLPQRTNDEKDLIYDVNKLVISTLRGVRYNENFLGIGWNTVAGDVDEEFSQSVEDLLFPIGTKLIDNEGQEIDLLHMFAALDAYYYHKLYSFPKLVGTVGDIGGWAGDLTTLVATYYLKYSDEYTIEEYMDNFCFNENSSFGLIDYISDIDGFNIYANLVEQKYLYTADIFNEYYTSLSNDRHNLFTKQRVGSKLLLHEIALRLLTCTNGTDVDAFQTNAATFSLLNYNGVYIGDAEGDHYLIMPLWEMELFAYH